MAETEVQASEGLDPSKNPIEWLDEKLRDAEAATSTGQSDTEATPAEPTVADQAAAEPAPDWRSIQLPDDVPHGFFKGKKVGDLFESYTHAEKAKQEAERQRNEIAKQYEDLRRQQEADAAARRVHTEQQQRPTTPNADPRDEEIERLWFENPTKAQQLLQAKWAEDARRTAEETYERKRSEEAIQTRQHTALAAGNAAINHIQETYGLSHKKAEMLVAMALPDLAEQAQADPDIFLRPEAYIKLVEDQFGDDGAAAQTTPVQIPQTPELPDPPGTKRTAQSPRSASEPSPLTREEEETRRWLAKQFGGDAQKLVDVARQRRR